MNDVNRRKELAARVEQRRRELGTRADVSERTKKLSQSSSRNPIGKPRKRSTTLSFIIGAFAVVLLVACVGSTLAVVAGGAWLRGQLDDPTQVTVNFYSSLHQKDYHQAYSYFSNGFKARLPESTFTDKYGSLDQLGGIIEKFPVSQSQIGETVATVTVAVTRRGDPNSSQVQTLHLIKENGAWRIDNIVIGATVSVTPTA